jgi:flagellar biosynthesis/type III secretory pathway chaperone
MQQFVEQLTALLNADFTELDQLEFLLGKEKTCLQQRDRLGLEKLASQKQQIIQSIERRAKQKAALLASSPLKIRPGQVREKLSELNDKNLLALWDSTATKLDTCKQRNQVNGTIISHSLLRANRLMNILRGHSSSPTTTYGQTGKTRNYGGSTTLARA